MPEVSAPIKPLPVEVAAQIKSSVAIPSLSSAILGLVANSLDAGARKVDIIVDFARGSCVVEDDGYGIAPSEFGENGGLGKSYHTSKLGSPTRTHGSNGTFLPSLAALSILSITSHDHGHRSQNTLVLHHSRPAARLLPAPAHHRLSNLDHGTRVSVQDLFGNMPVRVKQRAMSRSDGRDDAKEWDFLKRCIVGLFLAWDSATAITMRDVAITKKLHIRGAATVPKTMDSAIEGSRKTASFGLSHIGSVLCQAAYVEPPSLDAWVKTSARTLLMTIRGAFSLAPAPTKHVQFISLGIRPLNPESGGSILYDEINHIFSASSFGVLEDGSDANERGSDRRSRDRRYKQDGFTNKQLKGGGKGVDRWPMFYVRIELHDASHLQYRSDECFLEGGSILTSIVEVLGAMTMEFLKQHHFRPRARSLKKHPIGSESSSGHSGSRPASKRSAAHENPPSRDAGEGRELTSKHHSHLSTQFVESEAGSIAKRHKSSARTTLLSSIDTLGSNVKLPNFSQRESCHSGGSLDGWSRIKSGTRIISKETCSKLEAIKLATRSGNAVPIYNVEGKGPTLAMNDGPAPNTGNNVEAVVENLITAQDNASIGDSGFHATAAEPPSSLERECEPGVASEETVSWKNPISKEQVLISTRTGLIVPRSSKRQSSVSTNPESPSPSAGEENWLRKRAKFTRSLSDPFVKPKEGSWVGDCLRSWDNPTFRPAEEPIPQVSFEGPTLEAYTSLHSRHHRCSHVDIENAFRESSTSFSAKLSKDGLKNAEVVAHVDKKFILVKMHTNQDTVSPTGHHASLLVLIDQHAADERVRVEGLLYDLCRPPSTFLNSLRSSLGHTSGIATTLLSKPIIIQFPAREHILFKTHAAHFASWGILYDLNSAHTGPSMAEPSDMSGMAIKTLPPGIAERCRSDMRQLLQLLRAEVWKREELGGNGKRGSIIVSKPASQPDPSKISSSHPTDDQHNWLHRISTCPQGILDMLNSRSCRSAIMFNDELSLEECRVLVRKLAKCKFPFQCAHGRPSMVPLVDLGSVGVGVGGGRLDGEEGWGEREGEGFVDAWVKWNGRMKGEDGGSGEDMENEEEAENVEGREEDRGSE